MKQTVIHASPERVFAFHELPDAFERLVPSWEDVRIVQKADISQIGARTIIEQKLFHAFPSRWIAEHTKYDPPRMFEDVQISGPFKRWRHQHIVEPHPDGAILRDDIQYTPPMGFLGRIAAPFAILPKLEKLFEYRHAVIKYWCEYGE